MTGRLVGRVILAFACVSGGTVAASQDPDGTLRFEVEDYTTPKDAWQTNRYSSTKWNLWSTDKDAHKKWSGGVVMQSPSVKADRASPEEGAPVLRTVLTGIPKGTYDVEMNGTGRPIAISFDGKKWQKSNGGGIARGVRIEDGTYRLWADDRYATEDPKRRGSCYYDYVVLSPTGVEHLAKVLGGGRRVEGWAKKRRPEKLDRGVVALRTEEGIYVGWRMLQDDPADVTFDVYRRVDGGRPVKVNGRPISKTTDIVDTEAPDEGAPVYYVRAKGSVRTSWGRPKLDARDCATTASHRGSNPYVGIELSGDIRFQKVAIADLDGDGRLDYVIKHPNSNIDPYYVYWKRSPETYKLEAYTHDGRHLWTRDLGWAIERGIWYSPYIVCDLDGDGRAEIVAKTGEGDPRGADGKVTRGAEYLSVWNGMTGAEITRAPWPGRDEFLKLRNGYNYASRNQIAVAYLDGKTPCLIALRGTYNLMKVEAYQLKRGKLESLWKYSNEKLPRRYRGQGAHFTRAIDVDNDGRDEIMLGSVMLDDNGVPLWTTGLGHNDFGYVGDIDPHRPGIEIFYGIETRAVKNGLCLVEAATGEVIWGLGEPTRHIHGTGMCADIDPTVPGWECFGMDCVSKDPSITSGPWLWSAAGKVLWFDEPHLPKRYDVDALYWDADLQKETLRGSKISDYGGGRVGTVGGRMVVVADVLGDWREEVITTETGEMRIYSTTIPATDRRACLLQDRIYRSDITMDSMGYTKEPMTSYNLEAHWPGLNLTVVPAERTLQRCRAVVSAPLGRRLRGVLTLKADGLRIEPSSIPVTVEPGGRKVISVALTSTGAANGERAIRGVFTGTMSSAPARDGPKRLPTDPRGPLPARRKHDVKLRGRVSVMIAGKPLTGLPKCEAETIASQGGGNVRIRDDKSGTSKKAISHWDDKGHWLSWKLRVPRSGTYEVLVRYCTPQGVRRALSVDGRARGMCAFPATGGYGSSASDWEHAVLRPNGAPLRLRLDGGMHTIRLENADGRGMNLDYVAVRSVD